MRLKNALNGIIKMLKYLGGSTSDGPLSELLGRGRAPGPQWIDAYASSQAIMKRRLQAPPITKYRFDRQRL